MSSFGRGRKCAFGAKMEFETGIWGKFRVKVRKTPQMARALALGAARKGTARQALCGARSVAELARGRTRQHNDNDNDACGGGGRERRGSTNSGPSWLRCDRSFHLENWTFPKMR